MTTRRQLLKYATVGGSIIGSAGCVAVEAPRNEPEGWPMFQYDERRSGCAETKSLPLGSPTESWRVETGDAVWGSPAVIDDTVYIGSYDGNMYALETATGSERWRFRTADRIDSSPAYFRNTLYFGSFDQNVYAVDARTGREKWRLGTGEFIRSGPYVDDEHVYVGGGCWILECHQYYDIEPAHGERVTDRSGILYAIDRASGEIDWWRRFDGGAMGSPLSDGDSIYISTNEGRVYSFTKDRGIQEWQFQGDMWILGTPTIVDDVLIIGDMNGIVHGLDPETGDQLWEQDLDAEYVSASVTYCDDTAYISAPGEPADGDAEGLLYPARTFALDPQSGEIDWTFESEALEIGSTAAMVDDTLYFGSHWGPSPGIYAISSEGEERWRFEVDTGVGSSPAVHDGRLFFGEIGGDVVAIEPTE